MKTLSGVALFFFLCGCGSSKIDLAGLYQVLHHTQSSESCSVEGDDVQDPPYFLIEKEELFGQTLYTFSECESATSDSCTGGGLFFGISFQIPIDNGWRGEISASSGSGDPCVFSYLESSAIFQDDGSLRVEIRTWSEQDSVSQELCSYEEASRRGKDMPCVNFEVIAGDPVDEQ